jgi:hypothetical protein
MTSHHYGDPLAAASSDDDSKKEPLCDDCEDAQPIQHCDECNENYCDECTIRHNKKKSKKGHTMVLLADAEGGGGVLAIAVEGKDEGGEGEIKYRIDKADLVFLKEKLGEGAYGIVEKGIYKLKTANKNETIDVFVAIKMVNAEYLEDAKAMADIVAENVSFYNERDSLTATPHLTHVAPVIARLRRLTTTPRHQLVSAWVPEPPPWLCSWLCPICFGPRPPPS